MTTILAIEDNQSVREEIVDILRFEGYAVMEAENGREGLDRVQQQAPDLILCDLMMPELDGYETLRRLRAEPRVATIPFICLTARAERADVRKAMEIGADDYVIKPFTAEELIAAVRAGLEKRARVEHQSEERLTELRERISTSLPHELLTPLNIIFGYADLLSDPSIARDASEVGDFATGILRAAQRLKRLTENFVLYAELELLSVEPCSNRTRGKNPVALGELGETLGSEKAREVGRENDLVLDGEPVAVQIFEPYLSKLVEELIDNAFKFSDAGTAVTVRTERSSGMALLRVSDRGRGMTSEEIAATKAYVQFNRVINEQQGMGLGLSIVKQIANLSGGSLSIESTPREGTTVSVALPMAEPANGHPEARQTSADRQRGERQPLRGGNGVCDDLAQAGMTARP